MPDTQLKTSGLRKSENGAGTGTIDYEALQKKLEGGSTSEKSFNYSGIKKAPVGGGRGPFHTATPEEIATTGSSPAATSAPQEPLQGDPEKGAIMNRKLPPRNRYTPPQLVPVLEEKPPVPEVQEDLINRELPPPNEFTPDSSGMAPTIGKMGEEPVPASPGPEDTQPLPPGVMSAHRPTERATPVMGSTQIDQRKRDAMKPIVEPIPGEKTPTDTPEAKSSVEDWLPISPDDLQSKFEAWYSKWAQITGINPNPDDPKHKYDYRGAFMSGEVPEPDPNTGE